MCPYQEEHYQDDSLPLCTLAKLNHCGCKTRQYSKMLYFRCFTNLTFRSIVRIVVDSYPSISGTSSRICIALSRLLADRLLRGIPIASPRITARTIPPTATITHILLLEDPDDDESEYFSFMFQFVDSVISKICLKNTT